jgi:hypothetical protein
MNTMEKEICLRENHHLSNAVSSFNIQNLNIIFRLHLYNLYNFVLLHISFPKIKDRKVYFVCKAYPQMFREIVETIINQGEVRST